MYVDNMRRLCVVTTGTLLKMTSRMEYINNQHPLPDVKLDRLPDNTLYLLPASVRSTTA